MQESHAERFAEHATIEMESRMTMIPPGSGPILPGCPDTMGAPPTFFMDAIAQRNRDQMVGYSSLDPRTLTGGGSDLLQALEAAKRAMSGDGGTVRTLGDSVAEPDARREAYRRDRLESGGIGRSAGLGVTGGGPAGGHSGSTAAADARLADFMEREAAKGPHAKMTAEEQLELDGLMRENLAVHPGELDRVTTPSMRAYREERGI